MRLNFQTTGNGPALLILHGFLGSLDNWRSTARRLASAFKVITLDLRNHGHSPHHAFMTYPAMAEDVLEFLDQQNLASTHLLGHSMGGKVAMQLATTSPLRVDKLIVIDIAPKSYPPSHTATLAALQNLELRTFQSFGQIDAALAPQISSAKMRQFLIKNIERQEDGHFHWRIDLAAITANYMELTKAIVPKHPFAKLACFIRGGRSDYLQDSDFPLIQKDFPRAEFITIPHAGHWVHVDAADDFLKTVSDFLEPPSAGSTSAPFL